MTSTTPLDAQGIESVDMTMRRGHGRWLLLSGMTIMFVTGGLFSHAYGAYLVSWQGDFGWSATVFSAGYAAVKIANGLLGPLQGWLVDRYGPRRLANVGAIALAIGFVLLSQASSIETFFAAIIVIGLGDSLVGFSTVSVAIVNWFAQRRAAALSIMFVGSQAGPLLVPLVVVGLALFGWRATALLSAGAILVTALPASQLLRRGTGRTPTTLDERDLSVAGMAPDRSSSQGAFTVGQAVRGLQFWYLSLGHACGVLVVSAVLVHLIPHLTGELGFTLSEASVVVAALALVTILGSLLGGVVGDRGNGRGILVVCMLGHATAIFLLAYSTTGWMVAAFVLLHGLAWGVRGPVLSSIRADYFGLNAFGVISGLSYAVVMLGSISGPLLAGLAYDIARSYTPGFTLIGALALAGAGLFWLASRSHWQSGRTAAWST